MSQPKDYQNGHGLSTPFSQNGAHETDPDSDAAFLAALENSPLLGTRKPAGEPFVVPLQDGSYLVGFDPPDGTARLKHYVHATVSNINRRQGSTFADLRLRNLDTEFAVIEQFRVGGCPFGKAVGRSAQAGGKVLPIACVPWALSPFMTLTRTSLKESPAGSS